MIMFDKTKPNNELPLLPPDINFDDIELLKQLNKSNKALAKLNELCKSLPNQAILLHALSLKEAIESSGIENINTTMSEALKEELLPEGQRSYANKETINYKKAVICGYELLAKQ